MHLAIANSIVKIMVDVVIELVLFVFFHSLIADQMSLNSCLHDTFKKSLINYKTRKHIQMQTFDWIAMSSLKMSFLQRATVQDTIKM